MPSTVVITPPELILQLAEVKRHLRVVYGDDDLVIEAYLQAAQDDIDGPNGRLGIAIGPQTLEMACELNAFRGIGGLFCPIPLPCPPLISVEAVTVNGEALSADAFCVDGSGVFIRPFSTRYWNRAVIRYRAGYETVPAKFKQAMLLMIGGMYANRGDSAVTEDPAIARLLGAQKIFSL